MKKKYPEIIKTFKLRSLSSDIVKNAESHFKKNFLNLFKNALLNPINIIKNKNIKKNNYNNNKNTLHSNEFLFDSSLREEEKRGMYFLTNR